MNFEDLDPEDSVFYSLLGSEDYADRRESFVFDAVAFDSFPDGEDLNHAIEDCADPDTPYLPPTHAETTQAERSEVFSNIINPFCAEIAPWYREQDLFMDSDNSEVAPKMCENDRPPTGTVGNTPVDMFPSPDVTIPATTQAETTHAERSEVSLNIINPFDAEIAPEIYEQLLNKHCCQSWINHVETCLTLGRWIGIPSDDKKIIAHFVELLHSWVDIARDNGGFSFGEWFDWGCHHDIEERSWKHVVDPKSLNNEWSSLILSHGATLRVPLAIITLIDDLSECRNGEWCDRDWVGREIGSLIPPYLDDAIRIQRTTSLCLLSRLFCYYPDCTDRSSVENAICLRKTRIWSPVNSKTNNREYSDARSIWRKRVMVDRRQTRKFYRNRLHMLQCRAPVGRPSPHIRKTQGKSTLYPL